MLRLTEVEAVPTEPVQATLIRTWTECRADIVRLTPLRMHLLSHPDDPVPLSNCNWCGKAQPVPHLHMETADNDGVDIACSEGCAINLVRKVGYKYSANQVGQ